MGDMQQKPLRKHLASCMRLFTHLPTYSLKARPLARLNTTGGVSLILTDVQFGSLHPNLVTCFYHIIILRLYVEAKYADLKLKISMIIREKQ